MKLKEVGQALRKKLMALMLTSFVVAFAVGTASGYDFGYHVYFNGQTIGSFATEEEALYLLEYLKASDAVDITEDVRVAFSLVNAEHLTSYEEAADNFRAKDSRYGYAYTITLGDQSFALPSLEEAYRVQSELLVAFYDAEAFEISFAQPVSVAGGYVKNEQVLTYEEALDRMRELVHVKTVYKETLYECTPYDTVELPDAELYEGETEVVSEGISGENYVEYTIIKHDGQEIDRYVSGETAITALSNRVVKVGTKPLPKGRATGSFINPTTGTLSSSFGTRWSRQHKGIDISAPAGTAILATDGGTVIYAGWMSGYGNLVQIDHGNGYVTCYAHCSVLYVSVGQLVMQGETIAAVGSTGNSTGNHLHFEVRVGGAADNPLNYVNY